jgi:hypothetical protein
MESNTLTYVVAGIVLLHFIAGFGYLIYKLNGPVDDKNKNESSSVE